MDICASRYLQRIMRIFDNFATPMFILHSIRRPPKKAHPGDTDMRRTAYLEQKKKKILKQPCRLRTSLPILDRFFKTFFVKSGRRPTPMSPSPPAFGFQAKSVNPAIRKYQRFSTVPKMAKRFVNYVRYHHVIFEQFHKFFLNVNRSNNSFRLQGNA